MQRETQMRLNHILDACEAVQRFVEDHTFESYKADEVVRSAVERKLMIVGEALAIIRRTDRRMLHQVPDHRAIIDFRNILVHDYAVVEDELVWSIVIESVPELIETVSELLDRAEN